MTSLVPTPWCIINNPKIEDDFNEGLSDDEITLLALSLKNKGIVKITSHHTRITEDDLRWLFELDEKYNFVLKNLVIDCLCVSFRMLMEIITVISGHYLKYLTLRGLDIGIDGVLGMYTSLSQNKTLKYISFEDTKIEGDGIVMIMNAFKYHPKIEFLNFQGCVSRETKGWLQNILECVSVNKNIRDINLECNVVYPGELAILRKIKNHFTQKNKNLISYIESCKVQDYV